MSIIAGYMVPHPPIAVYEIGGDEVLKIQDTLSSFEKVAKDIARLKPETIILTSPHSTMYRDYFHISPGKGALGDFGNFRAPDVKISVDYDEHLVSRICVLADKDGFPAGIDGETDPYLDHGTMVPLYYILKKYTGAKLVRIGLSRHSLDMHWRLGQLINEAVELSDKKCVFVASGDLSHCQKEDGPYGYRDEGPKYDKRVMDVMSSGDFSGLKDFDDWFLSDAMECGHRSFTIMGGAFDGKKYTTECLSHEATFGVGYGFCMYHVI